MHNRPIFKGKNSIYIIDNGCKVEKFDNGKVVIYNTRLGGDFYQKVHPSYYEMYERDGFDVMSIQLSIDTLNNLLEKNPSNQETIKKIKDYEKKINFYRPRNDGNQENI
jgi:hypothetical protein